MNAKGHTATTLTAFRILKELEGNLPFVNFEMAEMVAMANVQTDQLADLEFVDVQGVKGTGRDNPHKTEVLADDDKPHYTGAGKQFTAFNHFIDIRNRHRASPFSIPA